MNVAVVILNWNGRDFLNQFLPSVIKHSVGARVYVADNASTDDSVSFLKANFLEVSLIQLSENLGFAGGYNHALQNLEEDYFVLLNSDVETTPNWITPIITLMDLDEKIAACQPKIRSYNERDKFEYAGASGGFIDQYGYPFCRGRLFDALETDNGQYDDVKEVFWATGACLFVRRDVYQQLGGLDEDFFAHMEEIDFCWRLKRAGYKVMVQPASVVYHVGGGTLAKSNPRKTFLNFRNGLILMLKNLPKEELFTKLFSRLVLDGVAAIKFLLTGYPRDFWAVVRAHGAFHSNFRKNMNKRKGTYPALSGQFKGSVVYQHFVKKINAFNQLPPNKF
ncbi:glycosyltransferase family 2 protein [Bacteroidota bacterium]